MKSNRAFLYLALSWLLTVGLAYLIGWWVGVKSVTHLAAEAAHTGLGWVLVVMAIVALIAGVGALRMRSYVEHK